MPTLEENVRFLRDFHDIVQLQNLYCHYQWQADGPGIASLFADSDEVEVEISASGVYAGADAPTRFFTEYLYTQNHLPGVFGVHEAVNPAIAIDGDRAEAVWLSHGLHSVILGDGTLEHVWRYGRYDTVSIRENGRWRLLKLRWHLTMTGHGTWGEEQSLAISHRGPNPDRPAPDRPTTFHSPYRPDQRIDTSPRPPLQKES